MKIDEYRADIRTVVCPLCQAGPGFHCSDHDRMSEPEYAPVDYVHVDRALTWHKQQREAARRESTDIEETLMVMERR